MPKKSVNLSEIGLHIYFVRNFKVLALKLLFFENFRKRKVKQ